MQAPNTFGYFSLPGPDFEPTTFRSMKIQIRPKRFPEDNGFCKSILSKLVLPILFNDLLFIRLLCKGEIHNGFMTLFEFLVSLIRSPHVCNSMMLPLYKE
jgi:hypothetical protein